MGVGRHGLQGDVLRVGDLHQGTDQTGAGQVGEHQRGDEDVEQGPPPRVPGPHLPTPPHFQDDQGRHVAKDASGEHDGADDGTLGGVDVDFAVTRVLGHNNDDCFPFNSLTREKLFQKVTNASSKRRQGPSCSNTERIK